MLKEVTDLKILEKIKQFIIQHNKLFFLLFSVWLFIEYIILGPFSYVRIGDNMDSFIPRLITAWDTFGKFGITYWHTYIAGGLDRLGNEIPYVHIVSFLFYVFPAWLAVSLVLIGGSFLGSWYCFRLCREALKVSFAASLCASIIFCSSFVADDIIFFIPGLCIVPVILFYLEQLLSKPSINLKTIGKALLWGLLLSLFSSPIFTLPFVLVAIAVWFFIFRKKYSPKIWVILLFFAMGSVSLRIQELMSLAFNSIGSERGAHDFYHATFRNYVVLVKKLISHNWLALIPMVGGWLFLRIKERLFTFVGCLVIFFVWIAPLYQPLATRFGDYFSVVRNFGFDRFYLLLPFFASLGVAIVVQNLNYTLRIGKENSLNFKDVSVRSVAILVIISAVVLINVNEKFLHVKTWYRSGSYTALSKSPQLENLVQDTSTDLPFRVATIGATDADEFVPTLPQFYKLETIDSYANLTAERMTDYFSIMSKRTDVKSDFNLFWQPSKQDIESFKKDSTPYIHFPLLSLANTRFIVSRIPVVAPNLILRQDMSYKPLAEQRFSSSFSFKIKENFSGRNLLIYENKEVLPRFFLTKSIRFFDNQTTLLDALSRATSTALFRENVFLNKEDLTTVSIPILSGKVEDVHLDYYSPDKIELSIQSDGPSILVITNVYNPFWKASINGVPKKLFPTYHTFTGVVLEEKNSKVVLQYDPPYKLKF